MKIKTTGKIDMPEIFPHQFQMMSQETIQTYSLKQGAALF
jgi:formylmethanofuran dehydrogenase subunit C